MLEEKFSRYEILEELGIGGMATVYRAYDPLFEREVAVKVLKRELLEDSQLRERFDRETKIIAKLEHAAIVPVYDVGHDNNQLFYVMRYMTGGSLSERIQSGMLTLNQVSYIIMRLAEALDYAHRKGVVHRDLKPGNILFDEFNNAFISDFGIAKFAQSATRITNSGILGTPRYISPEQARGDDADGRSDLYSLAVILFEILSGRAPFEATTPLAMAFKHATEPAPNILEINPKLPEGLGNVLKKALEKEPDQRYDTCVEFANAFLEALPESAKTGEGNATPLPIWVYKNIESPTQLPSIPELKVERKRSFRLVAEIAVVVVLGLIIWGYPKFTAATSASTPTPKPATNTPIPASPTVSPTPISTVTATAEPTLPPVDPGVGGAVNIAITSNRDVYLMDVDGTNIRQVTNTDLPKFDLQWLPGGMELLYGEGRCIYKVNTKETQPKPEKIGCFRTEQFEGFRVSPDGTHIAMSIERRLLVLPFDLDLLGTAKTVFELQNSENTCIDYAKVTVRSAQWSADGKNLAVLYQGPVGQQQYGDRIQIINIDLNRCGSVDPLVIDEFPGGRFIPEDYQSQPDIASYHWDGDQRFVFNTNKRNGGYGNLYVYDTSSAKGNMINPVNRTCCYRNATFSPDGTYILFIFQDINQGAESASQLYYIPMDQVGSEIIPFKLPFGFFPNPRENFLVAFGTPNQ